MRRRPLGVHQAFDEARFGPTRTLNLRDGLPAAPEAVRRAEVWLRGKQIELTGEVLIITGRGNGSPGGIPVIRIDVERLLARLRRLGVVAGVKEHTSGSFVVTLAPPSAVFEASGRRKDLARSAPPARVPPAFAALRPETCAVLHRLAVQSVEALGVRGPTESMIEAEMERQFSLMTRQIPRAEFSERSFAAAMRRAVADYDERDT
ncbi:MAG: hypothetical protein MNPFHGCM_00081 [Gemmatimonadaceae bacterium]|nr:hypothetical protein [Gemmatimonadaceae bacterium]